MARTLTCVAGPLHTETVEMPEDKGSYVDLASGTCYLVREPMTQLPDGNLWARAVLIHETIVGDPQETQVALMDAVMRHWFEGGRKVDAPESAPGHGAPPALQAAGPRTTRSGLVLP